MKQTDIVLITVSGKKTGDRYKKARTFPHRLVHASGKTAHFDVPVYSVYIQKQTIKDRPTDFYSNPKADYEAKAVRFMPYWLDSQYPNTKYTKDKDWLWNVGVPYLPVTVVEYYYPDDYGGAIPIKNGFLLHEGPSHIEEEVGSAGCVEIFGNYHHFLERIIRMLGYKADGHKKLIHTAMSEIVRTRRLWIEVQYSDRECKSFTRPEGSKTYLPEKTFQIR